MALEKHKAAQSDCASSRLILAVDWIMKTAYRMMIPAVGAMGRGRNTYEKNYNWNFACRFEMGGNRCVLNLLWRVGECRRARYQSLAHQDLGF